MTTASGEPSDAEIDPGQIAREQLAVLAGTLTEQSSVSDRLAVAGLAAQLEAATRLKGIERNVARLERTLSGISDHGITVNT